VELPRLQPLYDEYNDRGFRVIAVEANGDTERATKFIEEHGLTYTLLENGEDDNDVVSRVFKVRSLPTSFVIGRDGKLMYYHLGFEAGDEDSIEEEILTLL
jgi:peroxiredoxin